jgi:hypothetical protein
MDQSAAVLALLADLYMTVTQKDRELAESRQQVDQLQARLAELEAAQTTDAGNGITPSTVRSRP